MKTLLVGNGYWGKIVKQKLELLTNLIFVANSKDSLDFFLKNSEVDYIFICTPTDTHYELVKKCLEYKKNIFCEKPFTGDYEKADELFKMSKNAGVKLFVDNIFLYRNEFSKIRDKKFSTIEFIWNKYEEIFKEDMFNTLLYHDLYLLIELTNEEWEIKFIDVSDDKLSIILFNSGITSKFVYNRNYTGSKEKKIILDDEVVDFSAPKNDPLSEIICNLKKNKINFEKNKEITLKTINLLNKIKNESILYTSRNIK